MRGYGGGVGWPCVAGCAAARGRAGVATTPTPSTKGRLWPKLGGLARNHRVLVGGASSANLQAPSQPDGSAQYYSQRTTIEPRIRGIPNV
jgi:hypothetical protein